MKSLFISAEKVVFPKPEHPSEYLRFYSPNLQTAQISKTLAPSLWFPGEIKPLNYLGRNFLFLVYAVILNIFHKFCNTCNTCNLKTEPTLFRYTQCYLDLCVNLLGDFQEFPFQQVF